MAVEKCLICEKPIIAAVVDGNKVYLDMMEIVSFKLHQRPEARYVSATMHVTHPEHFASGLCKPDPEKMQAKLLADLDPKNLIGKEISTKVDSEAGQPSEDVVT